VVDTTKPAAEGAHELPAELGPFPVVGLLGEGGSARVYAARHRGEDVALKVPRADGELSEREAQRFLEEARMLARVRHGSVVEVLDSGRLPDGRPYLVMRRYEGETLAAHLKRSGALPLERALGLFEQLADATATLHDQGLLHRDIKPENVFLVDGGQGLRLLDFGIAKDRDAPASTTTQAGIARGTPATMAPERFFGAAATELTDVYELAVVLYAMVVGRLPWPDAMNVNARLNPLSPIEAGAQVPEALSVAIMRALSTRPERRPRNVRELSQAVDLAARHPDPGGRVTAETPVADGSPPESGPRPRGASVEAAPTNRSDGAHVIDSQRSVPAPKRVKLRFIVAGAAFGILVGLVAVLGALAEPEPMISPAPTPAAAVELAPPPEPSASARSEPTERPPTAAAAPAPRTVPAPKRPKVSAAPPPIKPGSTRGKPKGAPCTRSSECASMLCAAEMCQ
jgi:eukaryotic-like serine/threonine-protein kinase